MISYDRMLSYDMHWNLIQTCEDEELDIFKANTLHRGAPAPESLSFQIYFLGRNPNLIEGVSRS